MLRWLALSLVLAGCDRPDTYHAPQDCVWVSGLSQADIQEVDRLNVGGCGADAARLLNSIN